MVTEMKSLVLDDAAHVHVPADCPDCLSLPIAADRLAVLGQEQRLHIFRFLIRAGTDGAAVGAIQAHLGIPNSTLSHHLAQLVNAELVEQERQGRSLICRVRFQQMNELMEFLVSECCAGIGLVGIQTEAMGQTGAMEMDQPDAPIQEKTA